MAIARTGVYVDDYLEYANTLPAELQRLLNTIRELDERSQSMMNQTRQQTKYCLGLASQSSKKGNNSNYINNNNNNNNNNSNNYNYSNYNNSNGNEEDDAAFEKMRKDIEANQDSALSLCTEKVLLAQQAYDLWDLFENRYMRLNEKSPVDNVILALKASRIKFFRSTNANNRKASSIKKLLCYLFTAIKEEMKSGEGETGGPSICCWWSNGGMRCLDLVHRSSVRCFDLVQFGSSIWCGWSGGG
ncbi:hypothetical protein CMV_030456 [Castanea mollissima]|uniref:Inhibitor of growth protein N-terminal histone-binding domain-containing protein n=1 Tax=Castanea mollissima TaxID=60419 RepID=A0A8J4Q568_9ROSI|nr:hypothetical protein CMV_030456 [Castanea mollissima]